MGAEEDEVLVEKQQRRWRLHSPSFVLTFGVTERQQLTVLQWRNTQTGTDWVKAPVPFLGFGTTLNGVAVTSFTPSNNGGAFILTGTQHRKRGEVTELEFCLRHQRFPLLAILQCRAFDGTTVLEMSFVLRNEGNEPVTVRGLSPLTLTLHSEQPLHLLTLTGGRYDEKFPPDSFALTEQPLPDGASRTISCGDEGRSSAKDIAWFAIGAIAPTGEVTEGIVGGLEWSGRWQGTFRREGNLVTVRLEATEVTNRLLPHSELRSPSAFVLLFTGDWDEAGWQLHRWQERYLCPSAPPDFPWVQFNSWFGWTTHIDEATLLREADIAFPLGCEVFVVDAGWYDGCGTEDFGHGLGNWTEHPGKFPNGLLALSDYVHRKGMKFGLWVEPERVDLETELAKQHPDWLARRDGRVIGGGRYGHLCFGNPQVVDWFKERLSQIIADYGVDWLKWDYNIAYGLGCNDPTHGHQEGDGTYAHTMGIYEVMAFLRERFPPLVIEGCASGGNRVDFGILRHVHTYWLSDFTHRAANVRFHLTGAWFALPPCYLNAWVLHDRTSVADFRSRMGGAFGISPRLSEWDEETRERAKRCIAEYKRLRPFILKRRFLLTPQPRSLQEWTVWQFHDPERDQGALLAFREQSPHERLLVRLKGLHPNGRYELRHSDTGESLTRTGAQLMHDGITLTIPDANSSTLWWMQRIS